MAPRSSYTDRAPSPLLAPFASSVWMQRVGAEPLAQRHVPHGGAEVRCLVGEAPRVLGALTAATHADIPAGGTVVGVRLRPGVLGALAGLPADELTDHDVDGGELWRDLDRVTDRIGGAASAEAALAVLQSFVARAIAPPDPVVRETVRGLAGGALLPDPTSLSDRQLRRRCRAAAGVGPKDLQRLLRFRAFTARVQAAVDEGAPAELALWAAEAGYHDQAHLTRECRRLTGVTPGGFLAQYRSACAGADDHDHVAAYRPLLRHHGRSVQERARHRT